MVPPPPPPLPGEMHQRWLQLVHSVECWEEPPMLSCWYCPCQWMFGHEGGLSGEVGPHGHTLPGWNSSSSISPPRRYHLLLTSSAEGACQQNGSGSVVCHWEVSSLKTSTTYVRVYLVWPPATCSQGGVVA